MAEKHQPLNLERSFADFFDSPCLDFHPEYFEEDSEAEDKLDCGVDGDLESVDETDTCITDEDTYNALHGDKETIYERETTVLAPAYKETSFDGNTTVLAHSDKETDFVEGIAENKTPDMYPKFWGKSDTESSPETEDEQTKDMHRKVWDSSDSECSIDIPYDIPYDILCDIPYERTKGFKTNVRRKKISETVQNKKTRSRTQRKTRKNLNASRKIIEKKKENKNQDKNVPGQNNGDTCICTKISNLGLSEYEMSRNPRGIAVIIVNENFEPEYLPDLVGINKDAGYFRKVFQKLNFRVIIKQNISAEEIRKLMQKMKYKWDKKYDRYDCFVCCMSSHGRNGVIYGSDGNEVRLERIYKYFVHSRFQGTPKLFFFDTCQANETGKKEQLSVKYSRHVRQLSTSTLSEGNAKSLFADTLIAFSTIPDGTSYLNSEEDGGSMYLTILLANLLKYAHRESILDILTKVNADLAEKCQQEDKQVSLFRSTLTKKLVFRR